MNSKIRNEYPYSGPGSRSLLLSYFSLPKTHAFLILMLLGGSLFGVNRSTVNTLPTLTTINSGTFEVPPVPPIGYDYGPAGAGWAFSGASGIAGNNSPFTNGNPNAPEGSQVLFLQGTGSVSRSINVAAGTYRLQLRAAQRGNWQVSSQTFAILLGADTVAIIEPANTNYGIYYSGAFKVTSSSQSLKLVGLNPNGGDNTVFVDYIRAQKLLPWSAASSWANGGVPTSMDEVTVTSNAYLVLDQNVTVETLTINGQFFAASNEDLNLNAKRILATNSGRFEWGKADAPYFKTGIITLTGSNPNDSIIGMGAKFLGANGNARLEMRGVPLLSWTHLSANVSSGTTIQLADSVNWRPHDKIVITASRTEESEAEEHTILTVSANGRTITLQNPITKPHKGVIKTYSKNGKTWTADLRAEVGLLTHNIIVQGQSPGSTGFGGHMMIGGNAKANVDGIELYNMGQRGKLGRYPFHWHMQGNVGNGQFLKNSSIHHSHNRAVTIHGTESTLVENNFCYDHIGHGIFLEDGSERFNVIRKNVVLITRRPDPEDALTPSDTFTFQVQNKAPSSFWITNPQNTFEDNVAAGAHGTGFWFAFPEKPMGLSTNDPRFSFLQPYKAQLTKFEGNTAHSCGNGFDVFDKLSPAHQILRNGSWEITTPQYIQNCTWYANHLGLYTGIGNKNLSHNLIFDDNVIVENGTGIMFASYSVVDNSVIVAKSGENLIPSGTPRKAYWVYDGAGQVRNSYFVGWNDADANLFNVLGAGIKHVNHLFTNNTTNHAGTPRIVLENYNLPPKANTTANDPEHPRRWSHVVRDVTGGISGVANTSIVGNHPFQLTGDEFQPANWTYAWRSTHKFALSRCTYGVDKDLNPNVVVTRTKLNKPTASVYYINGFKEHHQLPFIVNEGYWYTYQYETLPPEKEVFMHMENASNGDYYIARFKDFGKFGGLSVTSPQMSVPSKTSLAALQSSSTSAYYKQTGGDLWVKAKAVQRDQHFAIKWTSNVTLPKIDTDGDQMEDQLEVANGSRSPFDANDLAAEFSTNNNFEGWTSFVNISGQNVSSGKLKGSSSNNGDAQVRNNEYNFLADEVTQIEVRMKVNTPTTVQMFFKENGATGYGGRVVTKSYSGTNSWQNLVFNMDAHSLWNDTIQSLRFDVVSGLGKNFEIEYIRSVGAPNKTQLPQTSLDLEALLEKGLKGYPNPFKDRLSIDLGEGGNFHTLRLMDLQGRVIRDTDLAPGSDHVEWSFEANPLVAGIYLLQAIGDRETRQIKVFKAVSDH